MSAQTIAGHCQIWLLPTMAAMRNPKLATPNPSAAMNIHYLLREKPSMRGLH